MTTTDCTCIVEAEPDFANYSTKYTIGQCPLHHAAPALLEALEGMTAHYVHLVESGGCDMQFWNPDEEPQVIQAQTAIKLARGETP